jgi:uncharacterized membrane protein
MSESEPSASVPPSQQLDASKSLAPALQDFKQIGHRIPPEALKDIPPEVLDKIKGIIVREETHAEFSMRRSAPLPLPSELAAYNDIIPQGADRIMKMAEAQSAHRIEIEKNVVFGQQGQESRGQYLAFIIALVGLACGAYTAVSGQPAAGAAIAGAPLVGIVSAFLYSKHRDKAELEGKKEQMDVLEPNPPPNRDGKIQIKKKHRHR